MGILNESLMKTLQLFQNKCFTPAYVCSGNNLFIIESIGCRNQCSGSCEGDCQGSCDNTCHGGCRGTFGYE